MALIEDIKQIAINAGNIIQKYYTQGGFLISRKSDGSPVTEADLAANHQIKKDLHNLKPSIPYLSEEGEIPDYAVRKNWQQYWLVDPLDGTVGFLERTNEFTVNIAMIQNNEPILGVIYAPALKLLYFAQRGQGSWKQLNGEKPERLYSIFSEPNEELTVVESRSRKNPALDAWLRAYKVKTRIKAGSSLKFCYVAEGKADIYPRASPTMEWDVAAGDCIYRYSAVGGSLNPTFSYNKQTLVNDGFVVGLKPGTFVIPK